MSRQVLHLPDVPATLLTEAEASTTYLSQANAAATYLPLAHQPGADVHPQYYNQARGDARYLQISTAASTYQPIGSYALTSHNHDAAYSPTAHLHTGTYLPLVGGTLSGVLRVDSNLGLRVAPAAFAATMPALQLGQGAYVAGSTTNPSIQLGSNAYNDGAWKALTTGTASLFSQVGDKTTFYTSPSANAGTALSFSERVVVNGSGDLVLTPATGFGVQVINTNGSYQWWADINKQTGWYMGYYDVSANWRLVMRKAGVDREKIQVNNTTGTTVLVADTGNPALHLYKSDTAGNAIFRYSNCWYWAMHGNFNSEYVIQLGRDFAPTGPMLSIDGVNRQGVIHMHWFPGADNAYECGVTSNRWTVVRAVNGAIQTSHVSVKRGLSRLDAGACADAVLDTDWVEFDYVEPVAPDTGNQEEREARRRQIEEAAPTRHQRGYVLGSPEHRVSDLFGLADRESTSVASDLAVVASALSGALKRIATLETHILQLEAAR